MDGWTVGRARVQVVLSGLLALCLVAGCSAQGAGGLGDGGHGGGTDGGVTDGGRTDGGAPDGGGTDGGVHGTNHPLPAVIPLEITEPQPGRDTLNRYYKAYPGLLYDVRVAVLGGSYPFTYTLNTAPQGMTVDAHTGVVTWPKPPASATPYQVSLTVTDSAGATATVRWTITVTTDGFGFVDAVNGHTVANGGTGTIDHPWKTMGDWYQGNTKAAKYLSAYKGWFLYYRTGTYYTHDAFVEGGPRVALSNSDKPLVWMAYPGDHPVIDMSDAAITVYSGDDDVWMSGLTFKNLCSTCTTSMGIGIDSTGNRAVFYRDTFENLPFTPGSHNQSCIKRGNAAVGRYMALLDNTFDNIHGYGLISYMENKAVVDGNVFSNFTGNAGGAEGLPIGPKLVNAYWSIRGNVMTKNMNPAAGIWVDTYQDTAGDMSHDIEVDYNCVVVHSGDAFQSGLEPKDFGPIWVYRNTFVGGAVNVRNLTDTVGPVTVEDNVIVNADKGVTTNNSYTGTQLVVKDNLTGTAADGIVDADGNLTPAYAKYLGTRGCQVPTP